MLDLGMISCLWQQKHKRQKNKWDTEPKKKKKKKELFFCLFHTFNLMSSVNYTSRKV